jgi:hypothetical protein
LALVLSGAWFKEAKQLVFHSPPPSAAPDTAPCGISPQEKKEDSAMRKVKHLKAVISQLRRFSARGELEQKELEALERSIHRLAHALKVGRRDTLEEAVNNIARIFLRDTGE